MVFLNTSLCFANILPLHTSFLWGFFGVIFLGNKLLRSAIAHMDFVGRWELRRWVGWLAMIARFKKLERRNIRLFWGVGG